MQKNISTPDKFSFCYYIDENINNNCCWLDTHACEVTRDSAEEALTRLII